MSLAVFIYMVEFVSNLSTLTGVVSFCSFVLSVIFFFCMLFFEGRAHGETYVDGYGGLKKITNEMKTEGERLAPRFRKYLITTFIVFCVSTIIYTVVPTKKSMYLMAGAYAVQKTIENPEVQKLNDKVFAILHKKMDEVLASELGEDVQEKVKETATQEAKKAVKVKVLEVVE